MCNFLSWPIGEFQIDKLSQVILFLQIYSLLIAIRGEILRSQIHNLQGVDQLFSYKWDG
jgi:hypothetical protein